MANPYHYGTPVAGEQFAGRDAELRALHSRLNNGINVVLVSPRRYGKTSLLRRAAADLEQADAAVVQVNVLRCRDVATLAGQLVSQAYQVKGGRWHRMRQGAEEFLRRFRVVPVISLEPDGLRFTFAPSLAAEDADVVLADVYALLDELGASKPAVLILDEFQAVTDLAAHLPNLFKALADAHPHVALVLAGSRRHLMARLVTHKEAPLYGMAEHLALAAIPTDVMTEFLLRRAEAGGKVMTDVAAELIVTLAGPVPNDIQHLAYETFDAARRRIDTADVRSGLATAVAHEAGLHADRFESLSSGQRRVVSELARNQDDPPLSAAFVAAVRLANPSSVRRALHAMADDELVVLRDGRWQVADPFFAAWLRQDP